MQSECESKTKGSQKNSDSGFAQVTPTHKRTSKNDMFYFSYHCPYLAVIYHVQPNIQMKLFLEIVANHH
jgi:hypothetical protein